MHVFMCVKHVTTERSNVALIFEMRVKGWKYSHKFTYTHVCMYVYTYVRLHICYHIPLCVCEQIATHFFTAYKYQNHSTNPINIKFACFY